MPRRAKRLKPDGRQIRTLRRKLLHWAENNGRHFFWRNPGLSAYEVLVTEILLTKTRAELVATTGREVLDRYRDIVQLSEANVSDLEALLYPLGLHRKRAAGLVACARVIVDKHKGRVPSTIAELMNLPSVGRYAATAIACVVFGHPLAVVDANVARVYRRMYSLPEPPKRLAVAHELWEAAQRILLKERAKQFNWAILDFGGTVCTAKTPQCEKCPLVADCNRTGLPPLSSQKITASN